MTTTKDMPLLRRYEYSQSEQVVCGDYSKGTYRVIALRDYRNRAKGDAGWTLRETVDADTLASFDKLPARHTCG